MGQSKKVLNSDSFTKIKQVQLFNMLNLQSLESVLGHHGMNNLFQNTMGMVLQIKLFHLML